MSELPTSRAWRKGRGVTITATDLDLPAASQRSADSPTVRAIDEFIEALVENATLNPQNPGGISRDGRSVALFLNPRKSAWEMEDPLIKAWRHHLSRDLVFGDNSGGQPPAVQRRPWNLIELGRALLKIIFKSAND